MDDARRRLRLERINAKGLEVATRLSELLDGKDVSLEDLELTGGKELDRRKKEQRLRDFLAQVNRARARLAAGPWGACLACGEPFDEGTLDEQPWIERCSRCEREDRPLRAA